MRAARFNPTSTLHWIIVCPNEWVSTHKTKVNVTLLASLVAAFASEGVLGEVLCSKSGLFVCMLIF